MFSPLPGAPDDGAQTAGATAPPPALTVLVAEDHEVNQMLMRSALAAQGLAAEVVADGAAAIAAVARAKAEGRGYAMIFMDLQMPQVDGYHASRQIRAMGMDPAHLPIVALTASPIDEISGACAAAGMQDAIAKPLPIDALQAMIARWAIPGDVSAPSPQAVPTGAPGPAVPPGVVDFFLDPPGAGPEMGRAGAGSADAADGGDQQPATFPEHGTVSHPDPDARSGGHQRADIGAALQARYAADRAHVLTLLHEAAAADAVPAMPRLEDLATALTGRLHRLSATAHYFGEANLGRIAGQAERELRRLARPDDLPAVARSTLAGIAQCVPS